MFGADVTEFASITKVCVGGRASCRRGRPRSRSSLFVVFVGLVGLVFPALAGAAAWVPAVLPVAPFDGAGRMPREPPSSSGLLVLTRRAACSDRDRRPTCASATAGTTPTRPTAASAAGRRRTRFATARSAEKPSAPEATAAGLDATKRTSRWFRETRDRRATRDRSARVRTEVRPETRGCSWWFVGVHGGSWALRGGGPSRQAAVLSSWWIPRSLVVVVDSEVACSLYIAPGFLHRVLVWTVGIFYVLSAHLARHGTPGGDLFFR